jgi:hypothetical protein
MRYVEFRDSIQHKLRRNVGGLTWAQLRERLGLPYDRPCPVWTKQLEQEIGLSRDKGNGRALSWMVGGRKKSSRVG